MAKTRKVNVEKSLAKARENGRIVVSHKGKLVNFGKTTVLKLKTDSGRTVKVLGFFDCKCGCIPVAVPQTGLPEQGKERVIKAPTSASAKADYISTFAALSRLTDFVNDVCHGKKWEQAIEEVLVATRTVKDKETGDKVTKLRYKEISLESEGLTATQTWILKYMTEWFNRLEKSAERRKAKSAEQPKAEKATA